MKIATWNVNSVKARLDTVTELAHRSLSRYRLSAGDQDHRRGLSRRAFREPRLQLRRPRTKELQRGRHSLEAAARGRGQGSSRGGGRRPCPLHRGGGAGRIGRIVRVASIYAPNGNPPGTERFAYKLAWLERLNRHIRHLLTFEEPLILAGDYNVIPTPDDCHDPKAWAGDALFPAGNPRGFPSHLKPRSHRRFSRLPCRAALLHILGLSSGCMG